MLVGAVLAGGASRRMGGRPKALIEVGGVPMARRAADALVAAGVPAGSVVLVGGEPAWASALGLGWVPDRWPGEGPLGGLGSALLDAPGAIGVPPASRDGAIVVAVACDQPWLTGSAVGRLVRSLRATPDASVALGVSAGRRQPFPSAWRSSAGPAIAAQVATGERRAAAAWEGLSVVAVAFTEAVVADVDRPGDLPPVP